MTGCCLANWTSLIAWIAEKRNVWTLDLFESLQYLFECRVLINIFFSGWKMMESVVHFAIAIADRWHWWHFIQRDATESICVCMFMLCYVEHTCILIKYVITGPFHCQHQHLLRIRSLCILTLFLFLVWNYFIFAAHFPFSWVSHAFAERRVKYYTRWTRRKEKCRQTNRFSTPLRYRRFQWSNNGTSFRRHRKKK